MTQSDRILDNALHQSLSAEARASGTESADPFGKFMKVRDVARSVGLSRAMIYRLMTDHTDPFPRPVKVGHASLWVEREVVAWKARRVQRRGS